MRWWAEKRILSLIANQLSELGFRHMNPDSLRPKHAAALVARWTNEQIATGTIKNRMSAMRAIGLQVQRHRCAGI